MGGRGGRTAYAKRGIRERKVARQQGVGRRRGIKRKSLVPFISQQKILRI
jgi:hypothetical protein